MNIVVKIRLTVIFFGLIVVLFVGIDTFSPQTLKISFFDIGQGDSIFIESPNGNQMLVDGGPDNTVLRRISKEVGFFDRFIDVVLATHPDQDHIGGLPLILNRYGTGVFIEPGVISDNGTYDALKNKLRENNTNTILARRGMRIDFGDGTNFDILFPDRDVANLETNTASIVGRLSYGNTSAILTGDSPIAIETYLVGLYGEGLNSDILKAGHHGSKTSSSESFVRSISPDIAIISAGKNNRYGHPHKDVTELFQKLDVDIFNTATLGTILCESDGVSFRCKY
jgi:competence protein ComEC